MAGRITSSSWQWQGEGSWTPQSTGLSLLGAFAVLVRELICLKAGFSRAVVEAQDVCQLLGTGQQRKAHLAKCSSRPPRSDASWWICDRQKKWESVSFLWCYIPGRARALHCCFNSQASPHTPGVGGHKATETKGGSWKPDQKRSNKRRCRWPLRDNSNSSL